MFQARHYRAIGEALKSAQASPRVVLTLEAVFQRDNPRFLPELFEASCGYTLHLLK